MGPPFRYKELGVKNVVSESQKRATAQYNRRNYEKVELRVKKGQRALIHAAADLAGKSINRYILDLVAKEMGCPGL